MQIRLATTDDHPNIFQLFQDCAKAMIAEGIFQWDEHYPRMSDLTRNIDKGEVWVYLINQVIAGTITLNLEESPEYKAINWSYSTFRVVHRLAVHPKFQRMGIAKSLMNFVEEHCLNNGVESIRLDTYTKNNGNMTFYNNLNYDKIGFVYFRSIEAPFACYEKLLNL
ncbi:MAG: GNAT family N-acetyltransferase [Crocinitomicaceae bacterium]|nr:GNAT family N-acetyltransferase [Crocinitomicaceae bacterium]